MHNYSGEQCLLCLGNDVEVSRAQMISGVAYRIVFCERCGVGTTIPVPDDETLAVLYSTQYYRNGEGARFTVPVEWLVEGMRKWRVCRLSKFVRKGRMLDVGCGSGRFLRAMRAAGWQVAGLELNDDTAISARNIHGLVVETSLDSYKGQSFDLITITHVLEHIRDPYKMLKDCARLLDGGGVLAIAVPNIKSWQAQLTRNYWFHLDLPRHLWHFSEKWLSTTLAELGFEQVSVRRLDLAHNIFGWLQSLMNILRLPQNRMYSLLSSDDLDVGCKGSYCSLAALCVLLPILLIVSVVLALVEVLFHAGGTVEIIARIKK